MIWDRQLQVFLQNVTDTVSSVFLCENPQEIFSV